MRVMRNFDYPLLYSDMPIPIINGLLEIKEEEWIKTPKSLARCLCIFHLFIIFCEKSDQRWISNQSRNKLFLLFRAMSRNLLAKWLENCLNWRSSIRTSIHDIYEISSDARGKSKKLYFKLCGRPIKHVDLLRNFFSRKKMKYLSFQAKLYTRKSKTHKQTIGMFVNQNRFKILTIKHCNQNFRIDLVIISA